MFDSPFLKYRHTNYVPTTAERVQIKGLLAGPRIRLANIKAEIKRTESLLDRLHNEEKELTDTIDEHYRLLFSPIRRIPDDLLREIFVRCLPSDHNAVMSSIEAPLILGRICSHWRSILFDTPDLWTSLHIPIPAVMSKYNIQRRCLAVYDWLSRSCNLALDISVYAETDLTSRQSRLYLTIPPPTPPQQPLAIYIIVLLSFSHRWRSFQVYVESMEAFNEYLRPLATLVEQDVPILTFLNLHFPYSNNNLETSLWHRSEIFKPLRHLAVNHVDWDPNLRSLPVNWSQLTYLSCSNGEGFNVAACHLLFNLCPMLVECDIEIRSADQETTDVSTLSMEVVIHLPSLESLAIRSHHSTVDEDTLTCLLESLDAPSLTNVTYGTFTLASNDRRSPLLALLSRNGKKVRRLSMDIFCITLHDLLECLASVPCLTHFTEGDSSYLLPNRLLRIPFDIINVFLRLLTPSDNHTVYLPCLQYFTIKRKYKDRVPDHNYHISNTALLAFIQGRAGPDVPKDISKLKHVAINKNYTFAEDGDILPILGSYIEAGMELGLSCESTNRRVQALVQPALIRPRAGLRELMPWARACDSLCLSY